MSIRLGVLGSGKGSNCAAIIEAIEAGELDAEVAVVMADSEDAGILELARRHGVRAEYIEPGKFRSKMEPEIEARMVALLREYEVDLVVLAGYMRLVKNPLLEAFPGRIINIHPSLLPAYPGLHAWQQAIEDRATKSGCTVHFVDAGMDTGEIIKQAEVPVFPEDTPEELHARIQVEEHKIYPEAIRMLAPKLGSR